MGTRRFRIACPCAAAAVFVLLAPPHAPAAQDVHHYFRVAQFGDAWWFVDPDGHRFLSLGVNVVDQGDASPAKAEYSALRSYGSIAAWRKDTLNRLARWGFDTLGAWSAPDLYATDRVPFTVCLQLGSSAGMPWVDMWDPQVAATVNTLAKEMTARWRHSRELIGYFTDNENPWWDETLFAYVMHQALRTRVQHGASSGWKVNGTKRVLLDLIDRAYHGDVRQFARDWHVPEDVRSMADLEKPVEIQRRAGTRPVVLDAFMDALYEQYDRLVTHAVRAADPDHLLLGERYQEYYTARQAAIAGRYNDVLSANLGAWTDDGWVSPNWVASMTRVSGRPVLVSEFYVAAADNASGNSNTHGSFPIVRTQRERSDVYAAQVRQMADMPNIVGWHWFQYYDEPPSGRPDGENYNMGLVDVANRPYPIVSTAATANAAGLVAHEHARVPSSDGFRFHVPAAPAPTIDGRLLDWDKARSWVPAVQAQPLDAPLGDMFVTATRGHLFVALTYQSMFRDASFVEKPASGWPASESDRFTVALARPDGDRIATVILRRQAEGDAWSAEPGTTAEVVAAGRGSTIEISIPIPGLPELRFAAELRERADAQVIYWAAHPLSDSTRPSDWGTLVLPHVSAARAPRRSSR